MRVRRVRSAVLLVAASLLLTGKALAVVGSVVDEDGKPIAEARVCYFVDNLELLCTTTDGEGRFQLPGSESDSLRAHAEGYNPTFFSAASQTAAVVLKRAPSLLVRLIDAESGERIEAGELVVTYASGKSKGPFPTRKAGVRIRRGLEPGEVRLVGSAEGYEPSAPRSVTLERGVEATVDLELAPRATADAED